MSLPLRFISQAEETAGIQKMIYDFKRFYPDFVDKETLMLMVSPDFSGIVSTIMAQALSIPGEPLMYIDAVHVPDPDEDPQLFKERFRKDFPAIRESFEGYPMQKFILVEAGVISGRNYSWLTEMMIKEFGVLRQNIITVALYQSSKAKFQCNLVGDYYDHENEDLCFWWEVPNIAFGDFPKERK